MGDHRAEIHITFEIHDKVYKLDWDWVNFMSDVHPHKIEAWFTRCWEDAYARYNEKLQEFYEEEYKEEIEQKERMQLKRLKLKYEEPPKGDT